MIVSAPSRAVLENFARIGFWNGTQGPEDYPLPSVMRSCMEYVGNDCSIKGMAENKSGWQWEVCGMMHGFSGTGFRFISSAVKHGGVDEFYLGRNLLDIYEYAFEAAGYSYEPLMKDEYAAALDYTGAHSNNEAEFRRKIIENIYEKKRPVIAIGVIGPPEPCVITGYDENGDVLIGWNFFQNEEKNDPRVSFEPSGCFRKRSWFADTSGIILIGEKRDMPTKAEQYRLALRRALDMLCYQGTMDCPAGIASYTEWAKALLDDARYGKADKDLHNTLDMGAGDIAERRCYGGAFLITAMGVLPEVQRELTGAQRSWQMLHDLQYRFWHTIDTMRKTSPDPMVPQLEGRRELASIVQLTQRKDLEGIEYIRKALIKLGYKEKDLPVLPTVPPILPDTRDIAAEVPCKTSFNEFIPKMGTFIDGVPQFDWWNRNICSFVNALETALAPTDYPYSYTDLMGYSGLAFRTRWFHNPEKKETSWGSGRWHPVSPHGEQCDVIAALTNGTGWQMQIRNLPKENKELEQERLTTNIVASVCAGLPVIVNYNTDLATVYGYFVWKRDLAMRDVQRSDQAEVMVPYDDAMLQSPYIFLIKHDNPISQKMAFLEGIRIAVSNGRRSAEDGFYFGHAAMKAWRSDLEGYDSYTKDERDSLFMTNWWCMLNLADARQTAIKFFESHKDLLDAKQMAAAERALDFYRQEAELVSTFNKENKDFICWWGGKKSAADWGTDVREREVDLLTKAIALEEHALLELEEIFI
ncbi:MAG: hypothetical protein ABFD54_09660 [Armatimonadota bacterium]|nr:hypothetical protein [bacterium]